MIASLVVDSQAPALQGGELIALLPPNTLGYALVRNLAETDRKVAKLIRIFHPGIPSPLELAKSITGLSQGLDFEGDAVLAYLANGTSPTTPIPMVLLPLTSYGEFAAAVDADATGEICRIQVAEVDLLVGKLGEFALVMNVEHRDLMRQALASKPPTAGDSYAEWIAGNDISLVVTPLGLAHLARHGWFTESTPPELGFARDDFGEIVPADRRMQHDIAPLAEFARRNFHRIGLGLVIGSDTHPRLRWKGEFLKPWETREPLVQNSKQHLVGLAGRPYALAGGGLLPVRANEILAEYMTNLSLQEAQQQGRTDFSREDWAAERKSWDLTFGGVQSVALLVVPPEEGEPLLSTCFARLTVKDSAEYLAGLQQAYELSNELTSRSTSEIKMLYEVAPTKIGQVDGVAITSDLDKATGDQHVEIWQSMLTACLGKNHQLAIYFSPVDQQHIFVGLQSPAKLQRFIEDFRTEATGLLDEPQVQHTLALVEPDCSYLQLISPQGLVEVARAWMKTIMVFDMMPQLPLFPASPPLVLTFTGNQSGWQGEVALPIQTVQAVATFVSEVEKLFHQ